MDVESSGENKGSIFTVVLPGATTRRKTGPVVDDDDSDERLLEGVRILVVDDRADDREFLTIILRRQGAEVRSAGSAAEALRVLEICAPMCS